MISVAWKFIVSPKRHTRRVIIQERKSISFAERKSTQIVKELGGRGAGGGNCFLHAYGKPKMFSN